MAEDKEETEEEDSDDEEEDDADTDVKDENGVLVLNDNNFDTFMEDKDTVLVEFYAPWWVFHFHIPHQESYWSQTYLHYDFTVSS